VRLVAEDGCKVLQQSPPPAGLPALPAEERRCIEEWQPPRHNWLIVELCGGGTLEQVLREDGPLPEMSIQLFAIDRLAGMAAST